MRLAILGAGGVGGLLGAVLTRTGSDVTFVAREATAANLAHHGVHVESLVFGNFHVPVHTTQALVHRVDACVIAVKSYALTEALTRTPGDLIEHSIVVPLLNGLDHMELLRHHYPSSRVVAATIRVEASRRDIGLVQHTSAFADVELANPLGVEHRTQALAELLQSSGFGVKVRDDERRMLWEKLGFLAPFALLTTHARATAEEIRTSHRKEFLAMVTELAAVAAAEGVGLDATRFIEALDAVPAAMESSMARDQAAGRPLELDAIGGTVLRRAAKLHVDTPVFARIVGELRQRTTDRDIDASQ